jgi:hypothetical protein
MSFFRNFALRREVTVTRKKKKRLGYELATVLNSTFCYELHQRTPDAEPPAVLWLIIGCKVTNK